MYTSWIRVKDRIMGMDSKYILCCCSWFCWFPTVSSFRLTLHRPPPPGGQCQMQSLSTQTSGGCTCGLSMSQVTKKEQRTSIEKKQVFWRNGTGNWVFQPRLQILHRILAPHLLHWPKVQSFVGFDTFHNTSNFENTIWTKVGKNFRLPSADWKCSGCNSTTKGSLCSAKLESLENKLKECAHPNDLEKVRIEDHLPSTTKIEWQNIKVLTGFAWWRRLERVAKEFTDFLRCTS